MLCLNMIVKNEAVRILRALNAAQPYISSFAILDTGSTDDTVDLIRKWGHDNGINGVVGKGTFTDFSQARNDALSLARAWCSKPHNKHVAYLLLQDADMELVVPSGKFEIGHAEAFEVIQRAGDVSYPNIRLLSVHSTAGYIGVTHEYLNATSGGVNKNAYFIDHADGANRADKYDRDIKLLDADAKRDPDNSRTWFYLGNSYRDKGNFRMAIVCYEKVLTLNGWDEERFQAQVYLAGCYRDLGDAARYVSETLKAYDMRPRRAEPLYDLAKFYRERGENHAAMLMVEKGITIPKPEDKLFVNNFVYDTGFKIEYSIAGFYTDRRERAFGVTNELILDPATPDWARWQARQNMVFYLPKLKDVAPTAEHHKIELDIPPGFTAMNPSITNNPHGHLEILVRTVNYRIDSDGRYMIGDQGCQDAPIITRNFLLSMVNKATARARSQTEVQWGRPDAKFPLVVGLEDMRIFWYRGDRHFVACVREQSETGTPEQWQGVLSDGGSVLGADRISDGTSCEKNWAPLQKGPMLNYMYRLNELRRVTPPARTMLPCKQHVDHISGSSQWIEWRGGFLAVVHEATTHPSTGKRVYQHRFAFIDCTLAHLRLSAPFVFQDIQIEFCAGIAFEPFGSNIIASYGVRDEEPWITTLHENDIAAMIWRAH